MLLAFSANLQKRSDVLRGHVLTHKLIAQATVAYCARCGCAQEIVEMETSGPPQDQFPRLVLRVGVTGACCLPADRVPALRAQLDAALRSIKDETTRLASTPAARFAYAHAAGEIPPIEMRMISPLAEGADRLAAEAALDLGYRLVAPLPFARDDYENDFVKTKDEFARLVARAHVVELDGGRGVEESASYDAVGRFVVRNCDVLLAVWNGQHDLSKHGGTADIVQFAVRSDLPVWWIDLRGGETRFLRHPSQWRHRDAAPSGAAASELLAAYLKSIILPPAAHYPRRKGVFGRIVHFARWLRGDNQPPLTSFLNEPEPKPAWPVWSAFAFMSAALTLGSGESPKAPESKHSASASSAELYWSAFFRRADAISIAYGDRYRSSYVIVLFLAFCYLLVPAAGGLVLTDPQKTIVAFGLLAVIGWFVFSNHYYLWQDRWITYRLLAELCRKQIMLAPLGRTVPGAEIRRIAAGGVMPDTDALPPRNAWAGWYFLAVARGAPPPETSSVLAKSRARMEAHFIVISQRHYHNIRHKKAEVADDRLEVAANVFFILALLGLILALAAWALGLKIEPWKWIELATAVFSAASATFFGLRAYSEFSLLGQESIRMRAIMQEFGKELESIDLDLPLSSVELGATLHRLALAMMQEAGGWAQLFQLKTVEPG